MLMYFISDFIIGGCIASFILVAVGIISKWCERDTISMGPDQGGTNPFLASWLQTFARLRYKT